jgi:hypothetical protein
MLSQRNSDHIRWTKCSQYAFMRLRLYKFDFISLILQQYGGLGNPSCFWPEIIGILMMCSSYFTQWPLLIMHYPLHIWWFQLEIHFSNSDVGGVQCISQGISGETKKPSYVWGWLPWIRLIIGLHAPTLQCYCLFSIPAMLINDDRKNSGDDNQWL